LLLLAKKGQCHVKEWQGEVKTVAFGAVGGLRLPSRGQTGDQVLFVGKGSSEVKCGFITLRLHWGW
jgi:hypothetical protein